MIVLKDADLEAAVYGATQGCFASAGQVCVSIERIYVDESIAERFLGKLVERTCALKLGASLDYSMEMGSLTGERQLQHVEQHVRDAVEKGAVVLAGGRRRLLARWWRSICLPARARRWSAPMRPATA